MSARAASAWLPALALLGFAVVATANASNMVLARANAGVVPPFSLAFFRWSIVAIGLLPFVLMELLVKRAAIMARIGPATLTGFFGMFVCGGPVYIAGVTTQAMNIALIFAATPVVVLLVAWMLKLEGVRRSQLLGIALALPGVLLVIARGTPAALSEVRFSQADLLVFVAMLGRRTTCCSRARWPAYPSSAVPASMPRPARCSACPSAWRRRSSPHPPSSRPVPSRPISSPAWCRASSPMRGSPCSRRASVRCARPC